MNVRLTVIALNVLIGMQHVRKDFWGESNEDLFMPKKRLQKIVNIFRICETVKVR